MLQNKNAAPVEKGDFVKSRLVGKPERFRLVLDFSGNPVYQDFAMHGWLTSYLHLHEVSVGIYAL